MRRTSREILAEYERSPGFADREREAEAMVRTAIIVGCTIEVSEVARVLDIPPVEGLGAALSWLGGLFARLGETHFTMSVSDGGRPS